MLTFSLSEQDGGLVAVLDGSAARQRFRCYTFVRDFTPPLGIGPGVFG